VIERRQYNSHIEVAGVHKIFVEEFGVLEQLQSVAEGRFVRVDYYPPCDMMVDQR